MRNRSTWVVWGLLAFGCVGIMAAIAASVADGSFGEQSGEVLLWVVFASFLVVDCLILAMNYITEYAYNSNQRLNHSVMLQLSLRTLGGNSFSTGISSLNQQVPGFTR